MAQALARAILPAALLAAAPAIFANPLHDLVRQDAEKRFLELARARGWVNYQYEVTAWVPPSTEQLNCEQTVEVAPAQATARVWGRIPYVLNCPNPRWEIRARAVVSATLPVVTARRNLAKGEPLNHSSLVLAKRDLARVHGEFVTDLRLLSGQRAKRALRSGQLVTLSHAAPPLLVSRGDQVLIRARANGFEASMTGEALEDGGKGQGIRVRNHSSGKTITAWVVERGVVETRF